jgi:ribonuclease J
VLLEDGRPLTLTQTSFRVEPRMTVEHTLVDGKGVGDVGVVVLRERRILGGEGMVIVVLVMDSATGSILHGPEIISKGFVFEQHYSYVLEDAKCLVLDEIETAQGNTQRMRENIRSSLRKFFRRILERDPVVVAIISEI